MGIRGLVGALVVGTLALGCGPEQIEDEGGASGGATSDTGEDTTTGDPLPASMLERCDAPVPCEPVSRDPGSNQEAVDPNLECAIHEALLSSLEGNVSELTESYCDIGCSGTDLLISFGFLYVQAWSTTDVTSYGEILRCTLRGEIFEPCQGQPFGTSDCADFSAWGIDCEVTDTVECP